MPEMSVIVLNWNGKQFLGTCLSALRCQTFRDFETILVDNGSQDDSVGYVRQHFPGVSVLSLERNLGFAAGNNAGYEQARGKLIVLLNNDTEADPHWLEEIHNASREFPSAGIFASKMLFFDQRNRIDNCGFDLTSAGATLDLGRGEEDGPAWATPREVFGACGGAVAYHRSMLEDIGFLDPDFFMNYEDVDLGFRARLQGFTCVFIPTAIVYHHSAATRKKFPAAQTFYSQRNVEYLYLKNMPFMLILRSLPQRLLYELGAAVYFFKLGVGAAFLRAKIDVFRQLPSVLRKRGAIQKRRTLTNSQLRGQFRDCLSSKWRKFWSVWRTSSQSAVQNSRQAS